MKSFKFTQCGSVILLFHSPFNDHFNFLSFYQQFSLLIKKDYRFKFLFTSYHSPLRIDDA